MFGRKLFVLFALMLTPRSAIGELEGIVFSIASHSFYQDRKALPLSSDERTLFKTLRIDRQAELESIYKPIRQELAHIADEEQRRSWAAKHGPTIRQINYDLWQDACEILSTDARIETYYRILLQDYLYTGRDKLCIASLAGVELTWPQMQEFEKKVAENQIQLQSSLAEIRRKIEAKQIGPYFAKKNFEDLRGEECVWDGILEDDEGFDFADSFEFEDEIVVDDTLVRLANHRDVLDELGANADVRRLLAKAFSESRDHRPLSSLAAFDGPLAPGQDQAIELEFADQKVAAEEEVIDSICACLSNQQFNRLKQIEIQYHLRGFRYRKVLSLCKIELDKDAAHTLAWQKERRARQEYQLAKAQLSIDMNAKSFDDVAGTNLAKSLGKMVVFRYGNHFFGLDDNEPTPIELYGEKYGSKATHPLKIPISLTLAPQKQIAWNLVQVPANWKLADAEKNLSDKHSEAGQIIDGNRTWKNEQKDLQIKMQYAVGPEQKALRKRYMELQTENLQVQDEFRRAIKIAMQEVSTARRIVKQLGGDPGPATDWLSNLH